MGDVAEAYSVLGDANVVFFRPAELADLDRISALEDAGFPPDEAASREALQYRLTNAAGCFLAAIKSREGEDVLIGYACGTIAEDETFTHETLHRHDPEGDSLWIHSVCVEERERRRGVATKLLRAYQTFARCNNPGVQRLRLISHEPLVGLYEKAGFRVVGPSDVVHGKDPWIEMELAWEEE